MGTTSRNSSIGRLLEFVGDADRDAQADGRVGGELDPGADAVIESHPARLDTEEVEIVQEQVAVDLEILRR